MIRSPAPRRKCGGPHANGPGPRGEDRGRAMSVRTGRQNGSRTRISEGSALGS